PECGDVTPASVNLNGKTGIAAGVNVGVMYNATRDLTFGASFRSQMTMKVKSGEASVRYNSAFAEAQMGDVLGQIHHANFRAQMPAAWVLGVGASYKGIDRLTLALDARLTGWHAYQSLDVEFLAESLQDMNQYIPKRYKNSWCFSAGAQYAVTERLDARLGMMIDTTPVRIDYYNPETPGMTKIEPTVGISFRPIPRLSIDLGFMYIHGCGKKNASVTAPNLLYKGMIAKGMKQGMEAGLQQGAAAGLTGDALAAAAAQGAAQGATAAAAQAEAMGIKSTETFRANYKLHAFSPSIGISYSF
ncbi:MAG: outer membrane protein transport protein, partial [Duncaniella sp.]|nr:outer membrane protein transport protein [Duncaniella sp.]